MLRLTPHQLLDTRHDMCQRLTERWTTQMITGTLESAWRDVVDPGVVVNVPPTLRAQVNQARMFRVSADMVTLVEHAAAKLRDVDTFDVDTVPSEFGYVRFDRPLRVADVWGKIMLVHVVTWGPMTVGWERDPGRPQMRALMASMWNDVDTEPDDYSSPMIAEAGERRYRQLLGRWGFIGAEIPVHGMKLGPTRLDPRQLAREERTDYNPEHRPFTNTFRILSALFTLFDQPGLADVTSEAPPRTTQRVARDGGLRSVSDISVVTLRRGEASGARSADGEGALVDWSCRWVVEGHWHRYWHGSGEDRELRRRWVSDYVKGPEDKPLRVTEKIYDLR